MTISHSEIPVQRRMTAGEFPASLPPVEVASMFLSDADHESLARAVQKLERPSLAGRLADMAGRPADFLVRALPASASAVIAKATSTALERALQVSLQSLRHGTLPQSRMLHAILASASGAVGGAFGLPALAIELPVSTMIMLRAIAAIAQSEGEDLAERGAALACLEVFALGGSPKDAGEGDPVGEEGAETGYFAVRSMLARALAEAADVVVGKGLVREGASYFARFLAQISTRYGLVVSEKLAAQAVPAIGAIGGAGINLLFIQHFQNIAEGHFTIRRLERHYGAAPVRQAYDALKAAMLDG